MNPLLLGWFAGAVLLEVGSSVALYYWLRANGVAVSWLRYGFPGYLESLYVQWCRSQGRSPRRVVVVRIFSLANLIAAVASFIMTVQSE